MGKFPDEAALAADLMDELAGDLGRFAGSEGLLVVPIFAAECPKMGKRDRPHMQISLLTILYSPLPAAAS